jgi:F-type H+-transporting ATPase subunit b
VFESFLGVNPWTALFILLNTLTIFFVAKKFLFAPVMKMIEDRQREIDEMYDAAGQEKRTAENLRAEYTEKLADAQKTSERIVADATRRGQARQEEILRQANEEANAVRRKAEADIDREKKKAINDAKNEIAGLAMDIAGKVVGQSLQDTQQSALVDQFIDELGQGV